MYRTPSPPPPPPAVPTQIRRHRERPSAPDSRPMHDPLPQISGREACLACPVLPARLSWRQLHGGQRQRGGGEGIPPPPGALSNCTGGGRRCPHTRGGGGGGSVGTDRPPMPRRARPRVAADRSNGSACGCDAGQTQRAGGGGAPCRRMGRSGRAWTTRTSTARRDHAASAPPSSIPHPCRSAAHSPPNPHPIPPWLILSAQSALPAVPPPPPRPPPPRHPPPPCPTVGAPG